MYTIVPEFPKECKNVCFGMDFGFTSDPTTLVKKGEIDGAIYYDLWLYKRDLVNLKSNYAPDQGSIEAEFEELSVPKRIPIFADCAEPKAIRDLCNAGWDVRPVHKGVDSILDGINAMKRYRINITERSLELIKEFDNYKWKENRDGTATNCPVSSYDHCFPAGTKVSTERGPVPIEQLLDTDKVLTRKGFRHMRWHGETRVDRTIILHLSNGKTLECHPDHKIWTGESFEKAHTILNKPVS